MASATAFVATVSFTKAAGSATFKFMLPRSLVVTVRLGTAVVGATVTGAAVTGVEFDLFVEFDPGVAGVGDAGVGEDGVGDAGVGEDGVGDAGVGDAGVGDTVGAKLT